MFLVELVMQGVRRFKDLSRLRFQNGFNLIAAGNESGKTTAVDSIQRLLYPVGDPAAFQPLISRQAPDASRGALVVSATDGSYYRVIEDFSKRGVNLSRYNAATKEFVLLHKDWDGAAQFMAEMTPGFSEDAFGSIFLFRREHFRRGAASVAQPALPDVPAEAPPAPPKRTAAPAGRSTEQEARIAELRQSLHRAEEAADAEYRAQSARAKLQETARKISSLQDLEERLVGIDADIAGFKGCDTLPEDLPHLIEEQERAQAEARTSLEQINQDIAGIQAQAEGIPTPNIVTDPLFIGGAVMGVGSVVAALFFLTTEQAAFFPIGVLLALGLIGGAWYKSSRKGAERKVLQGEIHGLETQRKEIGKSLEKAATPLAAFLKATGVSTPADLKDVADSYRYQISLRNDVAEQLERLRSSASAEAMQEEYANQQQEVAETEQAAREVAQHNIDTYSIRQEIERLEQEMGADASSASSGTTWDFGEDAAAPALVFASEPAPSAPGGFFGELETASRVGGIELDILIPAVVAACQRNLSSVTGGVYARMDLSAGSDPVVYDRDNVRLEMSDLSHSTADTVYFCLRAGLVEALAGKHRLPFVLDDPLASFDPARQKAACQVLRTLGAKTQVVLFTSNAALRVQGDPAGELK